MRGDEILIEDRMTRCEPLVLDTLLGQARLL